MIQTPPLSKRDRTSEKPQPFEYGRSNSRSSAHSRNQPRQTFSMHTDSDIISKVERKMTEAVTAMQKMAPELATARQVKEFSSDRLKRAFSVLVVEQLNNPPNSAISAAEHRARASDSWGAQLNDLGEQFKSALRVIEEYNAWQTQYEAARSLLSVEKEKMKL